MNNKRTEMIIEKPDNLVELFESSTEKFANNRLFGTKNKQSGIFDWITYGDVLKRVDNFRGGLAHHNIQKGDAVGIISSNRVEWAVAAFASYGLGARFVPMYESENYRTWEYIIKDSNVRFLLVSTPAIYEQIKKLKELLELQMEVKDNIVYLTFIGVEDLVEMTGWGRNTVNKLFDEPDFPCCDFGKEKKAEIHAVLQYFSKPHRKTA